MYLSRGCQGKRYYREFTGSHNYWFLERYFGPKIRTETQYLKIIPREGKLQAGYFKHMGLQRDQVWRVLREGFVTWATELKSSDINHSSAMQPSTRKMDWVSRKTLFQLVPWPLFQEMYSNSVQNCYTLNIKYFGDANSLFQARRFFCFRFFAPSPWTQRLKQAMV